MREIVLDTETTGLDPASGHRIVEIGCVELEDHYPTGSDYHVYLNPERDVPEEVVKVHGITGEFLADKPRFVEIADEFLSYIGDAPLVIHNAGFDMKFINAELERVGKPPLPFERAIDSIEIAKQKLPSVRYSLDELCKRFGIDLTRRDKHGALLDAELTAQVYLELIGGRQKNLSLAPADAVKNVAASGDASPAHQRPHPLSPRLTAEESAAHDAFVAKELGADAVWNRN
jgi:DNA polymerase III subunit epsilon